MSDPAILQFQTDLLGLGFSPGPLDGVMGSLTRGAAHDYARQYGVPDFSGGAIPNDIIEDAHKRATPVLQPAVPLPANYHRLTSFASSDWKKGERAWSQIWGVTLHQTGCPMGEDPPRWYGLKAHYGVMYSGAIYQVRYETDFGWHAQGQSHHNIGIEIAGFFAGIEGNKATRPGGPASWAIESVTEAQIAAVKELLRYLKRLLQFHGSDLKLIQPHRMATDDRQPDPGSKVWQQIAIPMLAELTCSVGEVSGRGMPLPEAWDPSRKGVPY